MTFETIQHGGGIARAAAEFGGRPEDWLDLSTGINPLPPELPPVPARAWARLPDGDCVAAAREAARAFYGASVLPLAVPGTQAVIQWLPRLVPAGGRAAILGPTYGEYDAVLARTGLRVDTVASLDAADGADLVVVVNPNNPDGRRTIKADLVNCAARLARTGGHLVVDEAFADADGADSVAEDAGRIENLVVFRSFGKFFGLAGLRLGFVLASDAVTAAIAGSLGPWAVSGPALSIAATLMRDAEAIAALKRRIAERHAATAAAIDTGGGLAVVGGTSLFFLVAHGEAGALHRHLCERHILLRAFDYAPDWLRIGLSPDAAGDARLVDGLVSFRTTGGAAV